MNRSYRMEEDYSRNLNRNKSFDENYYPHEYNSFGKRIYPEETQGRIYKNKSPSYRFVKEEVISENDRTLNLPHYRKNLHEGEENFNYVNRKNYNLRNEADYLTEKEDNFRSSYMKDDMSFLKKENNRLKSELRDAYKEQSGWYGRQDNKKYIEIINQNDYYIKENNKYMQKIQLLEKRINELNAEKKEGFIKMKEEVEKSNKADLDEMKKNYNQEIVMLNEKSNDTLLRQQKQIELRYQDELENNQRLTLNLKNQIAQRDYKIDELNQKIFQMEKDYSKLLNNQTQNSYFHKEEINNYKRNENKTQGIAQDFIKSDINRSNLHSDCEVKYQEYQKNITILENLLEKNKLLLNEKNKEINNDNLKLQTLNEELNSENNRLRIKISEYENQSMFQNSDDLKAKAKLQTLNEELNSENNKLRIKISEYENQSMFKNSDDLKEKLENLKSLNTTLFEKIEKFEKYHSDCVPRSEMSQIMKRNETTSSSNTINAKTEITSGLVKTSIPNVIKRSPSVIRRTVNVREVNEDYHPLVKRVSNVYVSPKTVKCHDCGCYCVEGQNNLGKRETENYTNQRVVSVRTNIYQEPQRNIE